MLAVCRKALCSSPTKYMPQALFGHRRLLQSDFVYRLGLSATPLRPHDEEGTDIVLEYFGGVIHEFSLKQAIAAGILCEYEYRVYVAALEDEEYEKFQDLTAQIGRLSASEDEKSIASRPIF